MRIIIISVFPWILFLQNYSMFMQVENYNCKKCGLTISSTCSKCNKVVDVEVLDDGCIVQKTKCGDCANTPVIKDVCSQQK